MRPCIGIALQGLIPLFAKRPSHPYVPLGYPPAGARSEGQGRPSAGASRAPLTAASTLAGWRRCGGRAPFRYSLLLLACALSATALPVEARAQEVPAAHPVAGNSLTIHIAEASQRFSIPEHWIVAVMRAESAGNARAVSSAGAMGLMQIMPGTWAELRARHRLGSDPFDPSDNILAGTAYLREMLDRYGNVGAMLAAYNAGPGRYDEYLSTGRALPAETRAYVAALVPILGGDAHPAAPNPAPTMPADWREAPLFVARSSDVRSAVSTPIDVHSGDAGTRVPAADLATIEPETGGLFVARGSAGGSP